MDETQDTFLLVENVDISPTERIDQQQVTPGSVTADKFDLPWQQFYSAVTSLFGVVRTPGGFESIPSVSPAVPNPVFFLGNGTIDSRYIKQGQIVQVYVKFTIGSTTVINGLTEDGSGNISGTVGVMAVNLPFPAAPIQPYSLGSYYLTSSLQASDNSITHVGSSGLYTQALAPRQSTVWFHPSEIWTFLAQAPATYNSGSFTNTYWSPGDYFEFMFEYETDYNG